MRLKTFLIVASSIFASGLAIGATTPAASGTSSSSNSSASATSNSNSSFGTLNNDANINAANSAAAGGGGVGQAPSALGTNSPTSHQTGAGVQRTTDGTLVPAYGGATPNTVAP